MPPKSPPYRMTAAWRRRQNWRFADDNIPSTPAMTSNPYEAPNEAPYAVVSGQRRRRLITAGCTCIAIALVCVAATVVVMMRSFSELAGAETPSPRDLADGIAIALVPSYLGGPVGIAGIVLIIAGLLSGRKRYRQIVTAARSKTWDEE